MRILQPDIPLSGELVVTHWHEITARKGAAGQAHADAVKGRYEDVREGNNTDRHLYRPRHRARMAPWKVGSLAGSPCTAWVVVCWAGFR